jgi:hypothetical protein
MAAGAMSRAVERRPPTTGGAGSFTCLGFAFSLAVDDPDLRAAFDTAYAACASDDAPTTSLRVERASGRGEDRLSLYIDDVLVLEAVPRASLIDRVVWEVNQGVIRTRPHVLLLHAAAVEVGRRAVVISARSGAGKSTLAAGLVRSGLRYLTDEAVAFDPETGSVEPYPKPIGLHEDVWPLFPELASKPSNARGLVSTVRYVHPAELGGAVGEASAPAMVIVPWRAPANRARMHPLSRAETAMSLAEQAFSFLDSGAEALELLAKMLQGCDCYRLEYDGLADAVRLVSDRLLERLPASEIDAR